MIVYLITPGEAQGMVRVLAMDPGQFCIQTRQVTYLLYFLSGFKFGTFEDGVKLRKISKGKDIG